MPPIEEMHYTCTPVQWSEKIAVQRKCNLCGEELTAPLQRRSSSGRGGSGRGRLGDADDVQVRDLCAHILALLALCNAILKKYGLFLHCHESPDGAEMEIARTVFDLHSFADQFRIALHIIQVLD